LRVWKRRQLILKLFKLSKKFRRQNIGPRRDRLPYFYEGWAKVCENPPQFVCTLLRDGAPKTARNYPGS
jgi:hypothetical protein